MICQGWVQKRKKSHPEKIREQSSKKINKLKNQSSSGFPDVCPILRDFTTKNWTNVRKT